ncbi:MAG: YihY/virulence factor BrkB family protein [Muribaculaceae bacterium]|nr:YihY/virulence factor BrkB family protein [Muribaculaceae bacterium]
MTNDSDKINADGAIGRLKTKLMRLWDYVNNGIWSDPRRKGWINLLRIANLSVNSFLNRDIQTQACAMTYRTMLAIVPALALLLAIGRGFDMQHILQEELFHIFPAQQVAISYALNFVDSYLSQMTGGVFLGVGIVFLLWTLISLLSNVEDTFNYIWGQKSGRSIWRKISDYTATLLILPILMLCVGGISVLLSSTISSLFHLKFLTPVISMTLEAAKYLVTFLFFTAVYMLIPNTKVKFKNAFVSGIIAGTGFLILQWLFVTGTLYVTRYNAIYGSFAFLPLLLLWIQFVWVICLAGAVVCYSSQNVFAFNLAREVSGISTRYEAMVSVAITAIITHRFIAGATPVTARDLMNYYNLPARLVTDITDRLVAAGIVSHVVMADEKDTYGFQLSTDPATLTVGSLASRLYNLGTADFVPEFNEKFPNIRLTFEDLENNFMALADKTPISSIKIEK